MEETPTIHERVADFYAAHRGGIVLGLFFGSAFLALWPPLRLLSVAGFLLLLALGVFWRPALVLAAVLVAPFVPSFLGGADEWSSDRPFLRFAGQPRPGSDNLDPDTRCYQEPSGFRLPALAWLWDGAHNLGLRLRVGLTGPPPATYHGPYLAQREAAILTDSGTRTTETNFFQGQIQVGASTLQISPAFSQAMLSDAGGMVAFLNDDNLHVRSAMFRTNCLLIRLSSGSATGASPKPVATDCIFLIDVARQRAFARYQLRGNARPISLALHDRWRR